MAKDSTKSEFWKSVLRAVEVEPRSALSIRGASGFSHPVVSAGIDEKRRRVVVISGEADARSAALAHGDIQAAMPTLKIMMARPVAVNLGEAARIISEHFGKVSVGKKEFLWPGNVEDRDSWFKQVQARDALFKRIENLINKSLSVAAVNMTAVWKEVIQQFSLIEVETELPGDSFSIPTLHLTKLITLDPAEVDRQLGVCSIPLYEFSPEEAELLQSGGNVDAVRQVLLRHQIFQYFFPSADYLALGFAEQSSLSADKILDRLTRTPEAGHPFGKLEIIDPDLELKSVVEALQDRGLLVEGEVGVEVTDAGKSIRTQVRFKPREGLPARLANIFSVKVDLNLKDLFK